MSVAATALNNMAWRFMDASSQALTVLADLTVR
jgi:hypothetical protein